MKKNIILWGVGFALLIFAALATNHYSFSEPEIQAASSLDISENQEQVDRLDFTLMDLDGNEVSLKDFEGKNVYLNFWATWCKWCVKEMPDLEEVYRSQSPDDFVLLAIDVGESKDKIENYIAGKDYTFPILLDTDKSVTKGFGITSIPVSIFIDKSGTVAHHRVGVMNKEQMEAVIGNLPR